MSRRRDSRVALVGFCVVASSMLLRRRRHKRAFADGDDVGYPQGVEHVHVRSMSQVPKIQKRQHPTREAPIEPRIVKPAQMVHRQIRQRIRPRPSLRRRRRTRQHRRMRITTIQTTRERRRRRQRRRWRRRRTRPRKRDRLRRRPPAIRARRLWRNRRPCPLRPAILHHHILTRSRRGKSSRGLADSALDAAEDAEIPAVDKEAAFLGDLEFKVGFGEFEIFACHEEGEGGDGGLCISIC